MGQELDTASEERLVQIDRMKTQGVKMAEKRCRKLCMGAQEFSPELDRARRKYEGWRLILRRLDPIRKVRGSLVQRKAKAAGITRPLSRTREEALNNLEQLAETYS